ncbi:hypothetical protein ACHAWO_002105 [Cyclotella atomus]|uniref:Uncharacterized protein n=1 Tax=Cyclotella atomus TaxID=382360 RepID=A0ABD3PZB2_9STRA
MDPARAVARNAAAREASAEGDNPNPVLPTDKAQQMITQHYQKGLTLEQHKKAYLAGLAIWVIVECIPFSACEKLTFHAMFEPFSIVAAEIVTRGNRTALRDYVVLLGKMAKLATEIECRSWTMDHWTPCSREVTYTCTTKSAINENWELINILTDFKVFEGSTRRQRILDYMQEQLRFSDEDPDVFYGVVDTTGSMGVLTRLCRDARFEVGYCTEHNFHLNALIAFNDENVPGADGVMKKCRALVEYFNKSTQATSELLKVQRQLKHYENMIAVGVVQDVVTRWWSTIRTLQRLLRLRKALRTMNIDDTLADDMLPTDEQWVIIEQICDCLHTMSKFQQVLEGGKFVTASLVIVAVFRIQETQ